MFSPEKKEQIYKKTDGKCHLCGKKLYFCNYGKFNNRGNWEVEHSVAKVNGGSNHLRNLYAACISCNRSKGVSSTRSVRLLNGLSKAPFSDAKKNKIKESNTVKLGMTGFLVTILMTSNPVGLLAGTIFGGLIGNSLNPDK